MREQNRVSFFYRAAAATLFTAAVLLLSACSPSLRVKLNESAGSGAEIENADFTLRLMPATKNFMEALSGGQSVFDANKISEAFSEMGFPKPRILEAPAGGDIQLRIAFGELDINTASIFAAEGQGVRVFAVNSDRKTMTMNFNKAIVAKIFALLPDELVEYSELLMAPALTGEESTEKAYTDLIAAAYGTQSAQELLSSRLTLEIECPGAIASATANEARANSPGGNPQNGHNAIRTVTKGNTVTFSIPVTKILVMPAPITLNVIWK